MIIALAENKTEGESCEHFRQNTDGNKGLARMWHPLFSPLYRYRHNLGYDAISWIQLHLSADKRAVSYRRSDQIALDCHDDCVESARHRVQHRRLAIGWSEARFACHGNPAGHMGGRRIHVDVLPDVTCPPKSNPV